MKILKLILALYIVHCTLYIGTLAQDNIYATAGRTKVLQWKSAGDYSAYDSLLFVVVNSSDERVIQKNLTTSYLSGYTTMSCTLYVSDTEDLTPDASYDYDIAAYGADTITVRSGKLNLIDPVQTSFNGTALPSGGTRFYVAGTFIDSTVADSTLFRYDETTHSIVPIAKEDVWNFLSVSDTVQNYIVDLQGEIDSIVETNSYYLLSIIHPVGGEELTFDYTNSGFTVDSIWANTKDSTITFNLAYVYPRGGTPSNIFNATQSVTSTHTFTSFENAVIPKNYFLLLNIGSLAGVSGEELMIKIYYR